MKLGHTTALVLIGWYLMAPPRLDHDYTTKLDAPFSQWVVVRTFDIATDCEREKRTREAKVLGNERISASHCEDCFLECIGTDDPRLGER